MRWMDLSEEEQSVRFHDALDMAILNELLSFLGFYVSLGWLRSLTSPQLTELTEWAMWTFEAIDSGGWVDMPCPRFLLNATQGENHAS